MTGMPAEMLLSPVYPGEAPMPAPPGAASSPAPLPSAAAAPPAASPDGPGASPPQMGMGGPQPQPPRRDIGALVKEKQAQFRPVGVAQRMQDQQDAKRQEIADAWNSVFNRKTQKAAWGPAWPLVGGIADFGGGMLDYLLEHPEEAAAGGGVGPAWREAEEYFDRGRYPEAAVKGVESVSSGVLDALTAGAGLGSKATALGKAASYSMAGMLAGPKAVGANLPAMQLSRAALAEGTDPKKVVKQTGWHEIPGGKMAFEISDKGAKLKPWPADVGNRTQARRRVKLSELLDHKELFELYPELKDIEVVSLGRAALGGVILPNEKTAWQPLVFVNAMDLVSKPKQVRTTLLHEIQHLIQGIEGWPRGTSTAMEKETLEAALNGPVGAVRDAADAEIKAQIRYLESMGDGWKFRDLSPSQQDEAMALALDNAAIDRYNLSAGEAMASAVGKRSNQLATTQAKKPFWEAYRFEGKQVDPKRLIVSWRTPGEIRAGGDAEQLAILSDDVSRSPATQASMVPGPRQPQMTQPVEYISRDNLPEDVVGAFTKLGGDQRGAPEAAMLKATHLMGGGVLNGVVEDAGDLIHRMSHMANYGEFLVGNVREKTQKILTRLDHPYGFQKELSENMAANARYKNMTADELEAEVFAAMDKYTAEHAKLPVYNRPQWLAREAAKAVGRRHFATARGYVKELDDLAKDGEAFNKAAGAFERGPNGKIKQYIPPGEREYADVVSEADIPEYMASEGSAKASMVPQQAPAPQMTRPPPPPDSNVAGTAGRYAEIEADVPVRWKGRDLAEMTPQDFKEYGDYHGVPNLGPLTKGVTYKYEDGGTFSIPGGTEGTFTYYDLLKMKADGIDASRIPSNTHTAIQKKLGRTMTPHADDEPTAFNGLLFGITSPNNPLVPNQMAMSRLKPRTMDDIKKLGEMIPWKPGDKVDPKVRAKYDRQIAEYFGIQGAPEGGLGVRGNQNYTRVAEMAQMYHKDPDWFVKSNLEGWDDYVERVSSQVVGLGSKTASFGGVWQDPLLAGISAIDRHMAKQFYHRVYRGEGRKAFEMKTVNSWNEGLTKRRAVDKAHKAELAPIQKQYASEVTALEKEAKRAQAALVERGKSETASFNKQIKDASVNPLEEKRLRKAKKKAADLLTAEKKKARGVLVRKKKAATKARDKAMKPLKADYKDNVSALPPSKGKKVRGMGQIMKQSGGEGFFLDRILRDLKPGQPNRLTSKGEVNPNVSKSLQETEWPFPPEKLATLKQAYRDALKVNQEMAQKDGLGLFNSQWKYWDRIRRRLEPHENMFPGLSKVGSPSKGQLEAVAETYTKSGHKTYAKETEDALDAFGAKLRPTKAYPNPAAGAYFSVPIGVGIGAGMLSGYQGDEGPI